MYSVDYEIQVKEDLLEATAQEFDVGVHDIFVSAYPMGHEFRFKQYMRHENKYEIPRHIYDHIMSVMEGREPLIARDKTILLA